MLFTVKVDKMSKHTIKINNDLCVGCGACAKDCIGQNIIVHGGKAEIISEKCITCGHCVAVCPNGAVSISGFEDEIEDIGTISPLNPDDVYKTIKFRRTIRQFRSDDIPQDIIDKIVDVGRMTHTAANAQGLSITVLRDKRAEAEKIAVDLFRNGKRLAEPFASTLKRLEIRDNFFFFDAPVVLVISSNSKTNAALAAANMEFFAEASGLGVLYSGFFSMAANMSPKLRKMLCIPNGKKVMTTLILGYPDVKYYRSAPRNKADVKYI